ncbi:hypothetical protein PATA110616_16290 [Paenibacillus tarimensis]
MFYRLCQKARTVKDISRSIAALIRSCRTLHSRFLRKQGEAVLAGCLLAPVTQPCLLVLPAKPLNVLLEAALVSRTLRCKPRRQPVVAVEELTEQNACAPPVIDNVMVGEDELTALSSRQTDINPDYLVPQVKFLRQIGFLDLPYGLLLLLSAVHRAVMHRHLQLLALQYDLDRVIEPLPAEHRTQHLIVHADRLPCLLQPRNIDVSC